MNSDTRTIPNRQYSISDGRRAVGVVEQSSAGFVAADSRSLIVGKFRTLIEATRSLPAVSSC
jgi:hypothetical protein